MSCVIVRSLEIGRGMPKICVPVMGRNTDEVLHSTELALSSSPDLIEWRIDYLENPMNFVEILPILRNSIGNIPLLFTFRTKKEGGELELSAEPYTLLLETACRSGMIDLVDAEIFTGAEAVARITTAAHANNVAVIGSSHNFTDTPDEFSMLNTLGLMPLMQCDIAKLAVMPRSPEDVIRLLNATNTFHSRNPETPCITMSMGKLGMVSRLCGETFGSCITFGSAGQASAPGQVPVAQLRAVLELFHKS